MKCFNLLLYGLIGLVSFNAAGQHNQEKFDPTSLRMELDFVRNQIYNVHANPWSELDRNAYDAEVEKIRNTISDSLTRYEFLKAVRPLFSWLSDEHAEIDVSDNLAIEYGGQCLPFSLQEKEGKYFVDSLLYPVFALRRGSEIVAVEGIPVRELVQRCATMATGYPDQRVQKGTAHFGFLYHFACIEKPTYSVLMATGETIKVPAINRAIWDEYIYPSSSKMDVPVDRRISYRKYGSTGYITSSSFTMRGESELTRFEEVIDSLFHLIKKDKIEELIIDVSNNSGGNSWVGNLLISYFFKGEIRSYQSTTKRSDDYLQLLKSWGIENKNYESYTVGETIFRPSYVTKTNRRKNYFRGKVYVLVGERTFSSAIMFATLIKDNKIAPLIGEKPANGHPTHFGEMYNTTSPILGLKMRFGIKEWIRPAGKEGVNELLPDIAFSPREASTPQEIIALLHARQ